MLLPSHLASGYILGKSLQKPELLLMTWKSLWKNITTSRRKKRV